MSKYFFCICLASIVRNKTIIGLKYVWGRVNAPFTVG